MFLHSTARSTDILNPGSLAIIPQHITMVRLFLVHKLTIVNRDPDETKVIYIQYARQSSVSTSKKEVGVYCRHLWLVDVNRSNFSGRKKYKKPIKGVLEKLKTIKRQTFGQIYDENQIIVIRHIRIRVVGDRQS